MVGQQHEWPTPSEGTRTFGQWTVSRPIGKGAFGHISKASNSALELVAIKVLVKHRKTAQSVDREVRTLRTLTAAANAAGDATKSKNRPAARCVPSQTQGAGTPNPEAFEKVALVLEPYMPLALASLCAMHSRYELPLRVVKAFVDGED